MDDMTSIGSVSQAGTSASNGTKRKRSTDPKFYAVRVGYHPGIYHSWMDCLEQVKGFKKAMFKSFSTLTDAERFVAGENPVQGNISGLSPSLKFYAVKSGRVPGIYTDWPSAQEQITGWQKPKHRCFTTRAEAQRFLDEDERRASDSPAVEVDGISVTYHAADVPTGLELQQPANKKAKKGTNGTKTSVPEYNEADYEPGTAPLPSDTEDGFDPSIVLDAETGKIVYKTQEQRQATKPRPLGISQTEPIRIHTDGSSLGNGTAGAFAGVGVYFGPGDKRNLSETLPGSRQTNQRAELTAILRALEIVPRNRHVVIITDSRYAIDCVTTWYINWRKNGWKTSAGKAVENKDIVENVLVKIEERNKLQVQTSFEWIKGHANHPGNVEADKLAVDGARRGYHHTIHDAVLPGLIQPHSSKVSRHPCACVTPTDPVLSNSIVKGKFADKNIPKDLQKLIIAESGANDGLGYPFLFFALYLINYVGSGGAGQPGGVRLAMSDWFGETWGYTILLSVAYGAIVGWKAKELLQWAQKRNFVDRESFLVFAITLALFIVGTCGMIGTDDILACFIAGNAFTIDGWFRLETLDDSLQPTVDMLLNLSIFMWFEAVCPWASFLRNDVVPIYRLIVLGILILIFRRLPIVFALHTFQWSKIWQIEQKQLALFVGFFGPIGVSAVFYLYVSLEFLRQITVDGVIRADAERLGDVLIVVIWFLAICSIVVHGLSVPLGKLSYHLPRTLSSAMASRSMSEDPDEPRPAFRIRERVQNRTQLNHRRNRSRNSQLTREEPPRPVFRIGGSIIQSGTSENVVELQTVDVAKERGQYDIESPELNHSRDASVTMHSE